MLTFGCVFVGLLCVVNVNSFSCLNSEGLPVDWFIIYKNPRLREYSNPLVAAGVAHFYMDDNSPQWILSNVSITDEGQALYNTLDQLYNMKANQSKDFAYGFYNDQPPKHRYSSTYGHTKGAIAFTRAGGFWLSHTIPKFPAMIYDGYQYLHGETKYGQTALCLSLDYAFLDVIGEQFRYNYPWVYEHHIAHSLIPDNPRLAAYFRDAHEARVHQPPWNKMAVISTVKGVKFTSFAKYTDYDADIYGAWLSQVYKTSLYTETWQHNTYKLLLSNCTDDYKVYNVKELQFPNSIQFRNFDDHAKWAVSLSISSSGGPLVCMADNNREETQLWRAGGALCFHHKSAWHEFNSAVSDYCRCEERYCPL